MDINLNRDIIIDIDLNNGEIDEPYNASYYNTDSNIAFFYVKLHKMNAFNFTEYISKEDAGNYKVVMKIVKPKTLIIKELIGTVSDDLDEDCAIYKFIIKDELMNEVGEPFCYISIYYNNQELVTNGFNYTVKQDPLGKYNLVLLNDPDMPLLKSLLEEIKNNVGGIDDENVRDDKSFSSYKTTQIANNLSSQIKNIVIQADIGVNGLDPCICDGITDDSDRLQALIDYVFNIGGGQVKLPHSKTIMIRKEIELKDNVSIIGFGNSSRIITDYGSSKNALNMLKAVEKKNIYLSNFYIENTGYGMSGTWEPAGTFDNVGACILAVGCDNFVVDNCTVLRGGNTVDGEGVANIYFSCCSNSKAINNFVKYGDNGIMCDTWYNQLGGKSAFSNNSIIIANNTITQMGGRGICIENKDNNEVKQGNIIISNNTINNCGYAGIQGNNTWNSVITGNVIDGTGTNRYTSSKAPTFFGIAIEQNAQDCVISDNTIKYCYQNGIRCIEASNLVINNNNILHMKLKPSQTEDDDTAYREGIFIKNTSTDLVNVNVTNNNIYEVSNGISIILDNSTNTEITSKYNICSNNNITFLRTNIRNGIVLKNLKYSQVNGNNITAETIASSLIGIKNEASSSYNTYNSNIILKAGIGIRFANDNSSVVDNNLFMGCNTAVYLKSCVRTSINSKIKNCTTVFDVVDGETTQANKCRALNCNIEEEANVKTGTGLTVRLFRSTAPTSGIWEVGDRIINSTPEIGSYSEWIYYTSEWKGINQLT